MFFLRHGEGDQLKSEKHYHSIILLIKFISVHISNSVYILPNIERDDTTNQTSSDENPYFQSETSAKRVIPIYIWFCSGYIFTVFTISWILLHCNPSLTNNNG